MDRGDPPAQHASGGAFEEFARRHGDYALCGVAALATDDGVALSFVGMGPTPVRHDGEVATAVARLEPEDDIHATAKYRRHLALRLGERVVKRSVIEVALRVNGTEHRVEVEPRWLLSDVLRHQLGLTGTHVGCEHGVCGCCTVLVDGEPARSCLMLAATADGAEIRTVEGLAGPDGELHPLQEAFHRHHGLQCGFCTPGFLMTALPIYRAAASMTDEQVREAIGGQLCRCTGYVGIVAAVRGAAEIEDAR